MGHITANSGLDSDIQYLKGVGPRRAALLKALGINTIRDMLYYFPFRYEDRRNLKKISELKPGESATIAGRVMGAEVRDLGRKGMIVHDAKDFYKKGRRLLFELALSDGTGMIRCKWFNQPYLVKRFERGAQVVVSGTIKYSNWTRAYEIDNPECEILSEDDPDLIHTARLVPVYRATESINSRQIRALIHGALKEHLGSIVDPMPQLILKAHNLPPLKESVMAAHFPDAAANSDEMNLWRSPHQRRLSFDEFFVFELGLAILKKDRAAEQGIEFKPTGRLVDGLLKALPFSLTEAQKKVFYVDIIKDMQSPYPMNRLLQGDVGSGKTVVALMAVLTAAECGYQSAFMAPTEILAEQHYYNIKGYIEGLGLKICIITGSRKKRPLDEIEDGSIDVVVGTHALIEEGVRFKNLGLAVIDEQHRFGVMQRSVLRKKGLHPDVLIMTATPIPRTLAMTLYGDLDYSVISELPPGRTPVKTELITQDNKQSAFNAIEKEVKSGGQVYVVYPLIEESEKLNLKSAVMGEEAMKKRFPGFRIALLHGRMKSSDKEAVMAGFKAAGFDILVSTTVIEVGVDVPNASLMVIANAERFGLSQLHQLRGRVGRGVRPSKCLLAAGERLSVDARKRLEVMCATTDGFRIAEEDLGIRGPGEFLGTRQSGLPDLRVANIVRDAMMLDIARGAAFKLIKEDPQLSGHPELKSSVEGFWQGRLELLNTG